LFVVVFVPQVTQSTDFNELAEKESWLLSTKLVVKPDMLFGKRGKSGLVALNLDLSQVSTFVNERLGKEVFYFSPLSFLHVISLFYTFASEILKPMVLGSIMLQPLKYYFTSLKLRFQYNMLRECFNQKLMGVRSCNSSCF
jgi:hypothetical protein